MVKNVQTNDYTTLIRRLNSLNGEGISFALEALEQYPEYTEITLLALDKIIDDITGIIKTIRENLIE